jgi:hypothetical protein
MGVRITVIVPERAGMMLVRRSGLIDDVRLLIDIIYFINLLWCGGRSA